MKIGYVASKKGEITIFIGMGERPYIQAILDPQIPQIPQFNLKVQIGNDDSFSIISKMAITALLEEVTAFLVGQEVSTEVINQLCSSALKSLSNLLKEIEDADNRKDKNVLDQILESESSELYEIEFDLPEDFFSGIYKNVVTASGSEYKRTDRARPYRRQTGIPIDNMIQNKLDPKSVIKKYRNNIYKHTPSKNYIITYDINGRPTGMVEAPRSPLFKSKLLK